THSDASRKIRPASLSCAPFQTTTVLPSPGWSLPSETSVSSPGRSRPLPSAATPVDVGPKNHCHCTKAGSVSPEEKAELDNFMELEHIRRMARARARHILSCGK